MTMKQNRSKNNRVSRATTTRSSKSSSASRTSSPRSVLSSIDTRSVSSFSSVNATPMTSSRGIITGSGRQRSQTASNVARRQSLATRSMSTAVDNPLGPQKLFHGGEDTVRQNMINFQHERDITELQNVFEMQTLAKLTEPNNWSPTMRVSRNLDEAKFHTRSFYRTILRLTPSLLRQYDLSELRPSEVAKVIRSHFEQYQEMDDASAMDTIRWNAQVDFTDVVRMHFTQSNVLSALFIDKHPHMLPKLPTDAYPPTTDRFVAQLQEAPQSDFLSEFLDPTETQRKARSKLYTFEQI